MYLRAWTPFDYWSVTRRWSAALPVRAQRHGWSRALIQNDFWDCLKNLVLRGREGRVCMGTPPSFVGQWPRPSTKENQTLRYAVREYLLAIGTCQQQAFLVNLTGPCQLPTGPSLARWRLRRAIAGPKIAPNRQLDVAGTWTHTPDCKIKARLRALGNLWCVFAVECPVLVNEDVWLWSLASTW